MQSSLERAPTDFSFLDQKEFKKKYIFGLGQNSIRFYISGIRCSKCVRKLENLSNSVPGLLRLRVEMGKNLAHADFDPKILSCADLAEKIVSLGFQPIPLSPTTDVDHIQDREDRSEIIRLGIAAACAGNIMTFSFATYLGATANFYTIFAWLSFVLYLPVVTYVAWPFYVGAWKSLQQKQISIDLPMAIASLSGFVFSTIELMRGKEDIYFDSLSGFLFLILLSRWGQKRLQRHFLRSNEIAETFRLERVRRLSGDSWAWVTLDSLNIGDKIQLYQFETLPAEAALISKKAYFGMAWLSGELKPKTFLQDAIVPAGARLESKDAQFTVTKLLKDTNFGCILQEVQRFGLVKNRLVSISDRWAQWLLGIVFTCAVIFLLGYWSVSSEEAIRRSLALIILACPCAMAFGTPLALTSALRKAQRKGLIIRNANVFENAKSIDTIFFDKTGTLTEANLSLHEHSLLVSDFYQRIILSLENDSVHPIAFAFRRSLQTTEQLFAVESFKETPGLGISGTINGKFYEIKKNLSHTSEISCAFFQDGQFVQQFLFNASLKPDCLEVLNLLRGQGYRLVLISGDKKQSVEKLAEKLNFKSQDTYYEVDPCKKSMIVSQTPNSIMIGDGVNDSLALMRAKIGIASSGGVEAALKASDVYLTEPSLKGVVEFLKISKEAFGLIRQNLVISVVYNVTGGTLALMGLINPFVAAVLMPISSGFILFSTWLRGRP